MNGKIKKNPEVSAEYIKTTQTYCVSCKKKKNENEKSSARETKQNRLMLLSNCAVYGKKKWSFIKNQKLLNCVNIWND